MRGDEEESEEEELYGQLEIGQGPHFFFIIYVAEWLCIMPVLGSFGTILVGLYRGGAARFWINVHYCKWRTLF